MRLCVWVCPNPGCGNYYGASGAGDLSKRLNQDAKGNPTFARSICPDCREHGHMVERIPLSIEVTVPS